MGDTSGIPRWGSKGYPKDLVLVIIGKGEYLGACLYVTKKPGYGAVLLYFLFFQQFKTVNPFHLFLLKDKIVKIPKARMISRLRPSIKKNP